MTAILTVLAIASIVFWYVFPLERYLPAAIVTARQVNTLFRFMAATGSALYIFVAATCCISPLPTAFARPIRPMRSAYRFTTTGSSSFGGR